MDKPFLLFRNPIEGVAIYKAPTRDPGKNKENDEEKYYKPMQDVIKNSYDSFIKGVNIRREKRKESIKVPSIIDFIEIHFFNYFNSRDFDIKYRRNYGLSPVLYKNFNTTVIFAVLDGDKFNIFLKEIQKFIESKNPQEDTALDRNIFFIREFYFYDSSKRKYYPDETRNFEISLFENVELSNEVTKPYYESMIEFFNKNDIKYDKNEKTNSFIIYDANKDFVNTIEDNFDDVMAINSADAGIIRPSEVNLPIREYGFEVKKQGKLPIIGVIDTGVSNVNPLNELIINSNDFNITETNALIDNVSHGTAVACFASLGSKILPDYVGEYEADSLILPIKIMDSFSSPLSPGKVVELIRKANSEYQVRIFTLAIGFMDHKRYNEMIREYAYNLDLLSNELDILIFISTGNYNNLVDKVNKYADYFKTEENNLTTPSDSMNNIAVGSIADNSEAIDNTGRFVPFEYFPASFTRKFNLKFFDVSLKQKNRLLRKPDIIIQGGDFDDNVGVNNKFALKTLSSKQGIYYSREIGTSYSAGIAANLAAKIVKKYPELLANMQTVKALIINSSELPKHKTNLQRLFGSRDLMYMTTGYGIPNEKFLYSCDENNVTIIIEDGILPGKIQTYPIKLPNYLNFLDFDKNLIEFKATMCFNFEPVKNNHLAYCPIHIQFGFFKNLPLEGINNSKSTNYKIKPEISWSEDYYYKNKFLSNAQKKKFRFKKSEIVDENYQFKIAVASKIHKLLSLEEIERYNKYHKFSLVITISELPNVDKQLTGKLYDEIALVNQLEAIGIAEAEAELRTE